MSRNDKDHLDRRWCSVELDDGGPRKRFRRALMKAASEYARGQRCTQSLFTPYWDSSFVNWLIYECTLYPAGCSCIIRDVEHCVFTVDTSGCQSEGICLCAIFDIPTRTFTRRALEDIRAGCDYYPACERRLHHNVIRCDSVHERGISFGPFDDAKYITHCEWWYDGYYDESRKD